MFLVCSYVGASIDLRSFVSLPAVGNFVLGLCPFMYKSRSAEYRLNGIFKSMFRNRHVVHEGAGLTGAKGLIRYIIYCSDVHNHIYGMLLFFFLNEN